MVQSYLEECHNQVLPHPTYSTDLSPCDFWLNPYIKFCLQGCKFETHSSVGSLLYQCVNSIPKEQFKNAFSEWISHLEMCPGHWRVLWRSQLVITAKVSCISIRTAVAITWKMPLVFHMVIGLYEDMIPIDFGFSRSKVKGTVRLCKIGFRSISWEPFIAEPSYFIYCSLWGHDPYWFWVQ